MSPLIQPGLHNIGISPSPPKKVARSIVQMKCIYTNAHSIGNKQKELEAIVQL